MYLLLLKKNSTWLFLKGSSVLMIRQKITKSLLFLTFLDLLVALRVGAICIMREWGTECCHIRRAQEGSKDVRRTCPCRDVHHTPPASVLTWGPISVSLAGFSSEDDCLALHYLENLNSFAF